MNFLNHKSKFIKLIAFFIPVILGISSCSLFENSAKHDFNGIIFKELMVKNKAYIKFQKMTR